MRRPDGWRAWLWGSRSELELIGDMERPVRGQGTPWNWLREDARGRLSAGESKTSHRKSGSEIVALDRFER